jgi:hypothetical protein
MMNLLIICLSRSIYSYVGAVVVVMLQLAFETDRDRNAAIMIARKFASNCNVCHVVLSFVLLCK